MKLTISKKTAKEILGEGTKLWAVHVTCIDDRDLNELVLVYAKSEEAARKVVVDNKLEYLNDGCEGGMMDFDADDITDDYEIKPTLVGSVTP